MPTTDAGETTAHTVDAQFLDLICADPDLLAAEFDAIITAEWPRPPTGRPGRGCAGGQPGTHAAGRAVGNARDLADRPRHPGVGGWARQRSPPCRTIDARPERKAGDRHT
jgi:hypothetical protein